MTDTVIAKRFNNTPTVQEVYNANNQEGSSDGSEEYAPVDQNFAHPVDSPDFVTGVCSGTADCDCGCQLDHPILIIEGLEDLFNGDKTEAAEYVRGVVMARSDGFSSVEGNEGPIFDGIKAMGNKALEAITDAFEAIKETISPTDTKELADKIVRIGERNKESLAGMKNLSIPINEKAMKGIRALAEGADTTGKMERIVSRLNNAAGASKVIDDLLDYLDDEITNNGDLNDTLSDTESSIKDLKKSASQLPKSDESNKEAVAEAKQNIKESIAEAKDAMKELKIQIKDHKAKVKAIKKAVSGITPAIFYDADK